MVIGGREFDTAHHTYVWGILNVTPDSFSDGGRWREADAALRHVEAMLEQGMDVLDIGGESTRPGYTEVSAQEEAERVLPVIRAVKQRFDVPISLDTCKAQVARAGLSEGADLINDIRGLAGDADLAGVIAESGAACCLVHNRKIPAQQDLLTALSADLSKSVRLAERAGISRDRIILDPGIGFGKSYEENLEILAGAERIAQLGLPVLLGCSRKSVIGRALGLPEDQREEGTVVTTTLAVMKGLSFVRVHDVEKNVRAVRMAEAVLGRGRGG